MTFSIVTFSTETLLRCLTSKLSVTKLPSRQCHMNLKMSRRLLSRCLNSRKRYVISFSIYVTSFETNFIAPFWAVFLKQLAFLYYSESRLMLSLVNVISRLMWSHLKIPFTIAYYMKTTGYCYHSVIVITFGLAQSDHIKRLLLYKGSI